MILFLPNNFLIKGTKNLSKATVVTKFANEIKANVTNQEFGISVKISFVSGSTN